MIYYGEGYVPRVDCQFTLEDVLEKGLWAWIKDILGW